MKRFRRKGLKLQHNIIEGGRAILERVAVLPEVKAVIPGAISFAGAKEQRGLRIKYRTRSGVKCQLELPAGIQEVFIIGDPNTLEVVLRKHLGVTDQFPATAARRQEKKAT